MNAINVRRALLALALASAGFAGSASAQETRAGDLVVSQPWSRATPSGAKVAGGYLTIANKGATADRLLSGSTEAAARVEVHEMAVANGVMTMRPLEQGVAIGPGQSVTFAPGGYHLMFFDPAKPLKQGDSFPVTLNFEKAGKVQVDFAVQGIGAKAPGSADGAAEHQHHMMTK